MPGRHLQGPPDRPRRDRPRRDRADGDRDSRRGGRGVRVRPPGAVSRRRDAPDPAVGRRVRHVMRELTYAKAIREATDQCMARDSRVYVIGLGVTDPKGCFGTTIGLEEKYGAKRVMDMPTSENGMTGVVIGSALMGQRPIMVHQRIDFTLLALDQ